MRSFQVCVCGQPLQLNTQPTPKPTGSEVLLKVLAAGVCHSDLHLSDGYFDLGGGKRLSVVDRGMKLPVTLGHENVGEVVAVGPWAKGVKVGDRRLVDPWMGCGECGVCKRGDEQLCTKPRSLGVFQPGGYSDYLDGAASALPVRHRRHSAGEGGAAGVLRRHHLWRAEEGRPDADHRADRHHRRRRPRPDVHRACTRRWADTARSWSTSIRASARPP